MARSRADGTPAKDSANKKAATPAKRANAKTESPERGVTRSSPRRGTLSTKAQEAAVAAEKVQAGRVTKKTSPKKASPAKVNAQTRVKKATSPAKAETQTPPEKRKPGRPPKSSKATAPVTKAASPEKLTKKQLDQVYAAAEAWEMAAKAAAPPAKPRGKPLTQKTAAIQGEQMPTHVVYGSNRAAVSRILAPLPMEEGKFAAARVGDPPADRSNGIPVPRDHEDVEKTRINRYEKQLAQWKERAPEDRTIREDALSTGISLLKGAVAALGDHDAIGLPLDDPESLRLRSICHDMWLTLRRSFGTALDDYLDKDIPDRVILRALLRVQGPHADGSKMGPKPERVWDLDNTVPLEYRDVVDLFGDYKRANQIESSPPRSPPRNGSEEQQGWWDYWEEHPDSNHEGLPFIFSQAAAEDAKRLEECANTRDRPSENDGFLFPTKRFVWKILAGPPEGILPTARTDKDDTPGLGRYKYIKQDLQKTADDMAHWLGHELVDVGLESKHVSDCYHMLSRGVRLLERHDAAGIDSAQSRRLRRICHKLWTAVRGIVGSALDECIERDVPSHVFSQAFASAQAPPAEFWCAEQEKYVHGWEFGTIRPLSYDENVAGLFQTWRRGKRESRAKRAASKSPAPVPAAPAARSERTQSRSPTKSTASARKPSSASSVIANASTSPTKRAASPRKSNSASTVSAQAATSKQNDRGEIISPTNPVTIPVLNASNRFFETLPAPEVWHRRMAPYFTFGETPAMQKLASDQIRDDLQRNTDDQAEAAKAEAAKAEAAKAKAKEPMLKKVIDGVVSAAGSIGDKLYGSPAKQSNGYPSPWKLPEVSKQEVEMELQRVRGGEAGASRGLKRPASPRKPSSPNKPSSPRKKVASPRKITQRNAEDEGVTDDDGDFVMSGGLS